MQELMLCRPFNSTYSFSTCWRSCFSSAVIDIRQCPNGRGHVQNSSALPLDLQLVLEQSDHFFQFLNFCLRVLFADAAGMIRMGGINGTHLDRFRLTTKKLVVCHGDFRKH